MRNCFCTTLVTPSTPSLSLLGTNLGKKMAPVHGFDGQSEIQPRPGLVVVLDDGNGEVEVVNVDHVLRFLALRSKTWSSKETRERKTLPTHLVAEANWYLGDFYVNEHVVVSGAFLKTKIFKLKKKTPAFCMSQRYLCLQESQTFCFKGKEFYQTAKEDPKHFLEEIVSEVFKNSVPKFDEMK